MYAGTFEICLANLREQLPLNWSVYMTKEEALDKLRAMTGQDFGFDDKLWEEWGDTHGLFLMPRNPR